MSYMRNISTASYTRATDDISGMEHIMRDNHNGGKGFSLIKTYDWQHRAFAKACNEGSDKTHIRQLKCSLNRTIEAIMSRILSLGTINARCDISSRELTDEACDVLKKLISDGYVDIIVAEVKRVYGGAKTAKMCHSLFVIAMLSSVSKDVAGSQIKQGLIRKKGYELWISIRTLGQLTELIGIHRVLRGGTGNGFRKACNGWINRVIEEKGVDFLAKQFAKYWGGRGPAENKWTTKDVVRTAHPTPTSAKRCSCHGKEACQCEKPDPKELENLLPVSAQVTLAIVVQDMDHMFKILHEGIQRARYKIEQSTGHTVSLSDKSLTGDNDLLDAVNVTAFWCAVSEAKNEATTPERVADLIKLFNLTHEMVSKSSLNDPAVMQAHVFKNTSVPQDTLKKLKDATSYELLCKYGSKWMDVLEYARLTIGAHAAPETKDHASGDITPFVPKNYNVRQPFTALVRNLNRYGPLFEGNNGQALLQIVSAHIKNLHVLELGFADPIFLLNAAEVYGSGKGVRGNKTWNVFRQLVDGLNTGARARLNSFMKGIKEGVAFGLDFSGSMTWENSVQGMQITANKVAIVIVLSYLLGMKKHADDNHTLMPPYMVGYFGGSCGYSLDKSRLRPGSVEEARYHARAFKDITHKVSPEMPYDSATQLAKDSSWGGTNIGSFAWKCVEQVRESITKLRAGEMKEFLPTQVPGVYKILMVLTDNDCNGGHQPMNVLNEYRRCVSQVYRLRPYDADGKRQDWRKLYAANVPKLVVLATQGTDVTVGDPTDPNVLNVSGFDQDTPAIIQQFLRGDFDLTGE
jgi:hypothetical protein